MKTRTLIVLFVATTIGGVVLLFVGGGGSGGKSVSLGTPTAAACTTQECLPQVQFIDVDGKVYSPASLAGKVVVVNFWATWCGPCQKEIPAFSRIYDKYKDKGVVFLGVMSDNPDGSTLANFRSDFNMTYPIVRSNQDLQLAFNYPEALPTTFVFDRSGRPALGKPHVGPLSESSLEQILAPLVEQK